MYKYSFIVCLVFSLNLVNAQKNSGHYLLVGTYTSGKSEGIYVYNFNTTTGDSKLVSTAKTSNPSFLAVSPNNKYVYAVSENADSTRFTVTGHIAAFSFDKKTGKLSFINKQESGGKHPCFVAVDKTGKWVFAGNYSSGSAIMLPVNPDGGLGIDAQLMQHTGSSVVEGRQETSHVHATVLSKDNKTLYVPDLGIDKVMIYDFDAKKGKIKPASIQSVVTEAGAGPRHMDIHPNGKYVYLIQELLGSVSVYQSGKNGNLSLIQELSCLPRDYKGPIGSADIHVSPDGKFLYASNRGESNSIGIFKIDPKTGMIEWVDYQNTLGKTPRNFNFDPTGNYLLVANQDSDEIVLFKRNTETGLLTDTGKRINVPNPVCIKWIAAQ